MNNVQREDCQNIGRSSFIDWKKLHNATVVITGATGLIGSNLVNVLAFNSQEKGLNIKIILPVRKKELAEQLFNWTNAEIIQYELGAELPEEINADYIVHLASPTSSKWFSEKPVETILANLEGTNALLESAKKRPIKKFIYVSSMEVYGFPEKGHLVKENELGSFETMKARNSYPLAKMASEALCYSYRSEYEVPAVVLRATQTFGPGVKYDDGRVFAEFMRCALQKRDIVLKSPGLTERSYLYTADAVSAIVVAMLQGDPGHSYTVANPDTYCSIRDMAELVSEELTKGAIQVIAVDAGDYSSLGYADTLYMKLDITKLSSLGWRPTVGLAEMYKRMIRGIEEDGCTR